jgi:hypothetical protein
MKTNASHPPRPEDSQPDLARRSLLKAAPLGALAVVAVRASAA